MKSFKRALAVLMALTLTLTTVAFASFTDVTSGSKFEEAIGIGTALNLFKGYEDGTFKPDGDITRAEFAAIVTRALGGEAVASSKQATEFTDVAADHWASGYINYGVAQKIINGMGDGTFAPEENVTYEQAIKMLVVALGYEKQVTGGYPSGYLTVGSSIGLADAVGGQVGVKATRGQVAQLIYNALDIPLMQRTSYGSYEEWKIQDGYDDTTRKTLLSEKMSVVKLKGFVVDSNEFSSAKDMNVTFKVTNNYNSRYEDDFAEGTSYTIMVGDSNANSFVGYNAIAYVVHDSAAYDDDTVLYIKKDIKSADELTVNSDDLELDAPIYSPTNNTDVYQISYWASETANKVDKFTIDKTSSVYINGAKSTVTVANLFTDNSSDANKYLANGSVTFSKVDSDADGDYNMVSVTSYQNFVVDYINESSYKVSSKAGQLSSIGYDPKDTSIRSTLYDKDGKVVDFSTLQEDDVLSVKQTTGSVTVTVAYLVTDSIDGTVTEIDNSGSDTKYKIADKWYKVDGDTYTKNIKNGDVGTFLLDINGKIVGFNKDSGRTGKYAYIIDIAPTDGSMNKTVDIKLFNYEGQVQTLKTYSKVKLDDTSYDALRIVDQSDFTGRDFTGYDEVSNPVEAGQFVTYALNGSGEVTEINRPVASKSSDEDFALYSTGGELVTNLFAKTGTEFNYLEDTEYNADAESVSVKGGKVYIDDKTVIMLAPTTATEDADYELLSKSILDDDQELLQVAAFDVDSDTRVANAILITHDVDIVSATSGLATVVSRAQTTDADDNDIFRYTVIQNGESKTLDTTEKTSALEMEKNYTFAPKYDASGKIKSVNTLVYAKDGLFQYGKTGSALNLATVVPKTVYYYGKIVDKRSSIITVLNPDGSTEDVSLNGAKIALFDARNSSSNQVLAGSVGDIDLRQRTTSGTTKIEYGTDIKNIYVLVREYDGDITDAAVYIFKGTPTVNDTSITDYE